MGKVVILSDNIPPITSGLGDIFGSRFQTIRKFYSYKIEKTKLDAGIFRIVLKEMKLKPEEYVFVDDKIYNILTARKCGIKSIHFKNNRDLCL